MLISFCAWTGDTGQVLTKRKFNDSTRASCPLTFRHSYRATVIKLSGEKKVKRETWKIPAGEKWKRESTKAFSASAPVSAYVRCSQELKTMEPLPNMSKRMSIIDENKLCDDPEQIAKQIEALEVDEEDLFEGCGREGPIRAIFLSEFHHIVGPKIVFQFPEDAISKELFDVISSYIIPKSHLQRLVLTVNVLGRKVIGYPIQIKSDYYERNAYYFNVCFVCDAWARTVQYEQVLVKLAEFFYALEVESHFLSKRSQQPQQGPGAQQSSEKTVGENETLPVIGSPPSLSISGQASPNIQLQSAAPQFTGCSSATCSVNTSNNPSAGRTIPLANIEPLRKSILRKIFSAVLQGLNSQSRECQIIVEDIIAPEVRRLLKLKVIPFVANDPPPVHNYQVPVFLIDVNPIDAWDLTTQQLIPYINGFNHVSRIATLADVDLNLVKICVQNLLYYRVIKLVPIFLYGNTYCTLPNIDEKLVMGSEQFKLDCIEFVSRLEHSKPSFSDVVKFYCAMKRGVTMKELCTRFRTTLATTPLSTIPPNYRLSSFLERKCSDSYSLSSSTQSNQSPRTVSNPTTPIKLIRSIVPTANESPSMMTTMTPLLLKLGPSTTSSTGDKKDGPTATRTRSSASESHQTILNLIDERYLVLFGLIHSFIRRIEKYPVLQMGPQRHSSFSLTTHNSSIISNSSAYHMHQSSGASDTSAHKSESKEDTLLNRRQKHNALYGMFTGRHSYDEICLMHDISHADLDTIIENDPDIVTIWK